MISSLNVSKRDEPTELKKCFYTPLAILLLQGSKQTIFRDREFTFSQGQYMVCSVDIPIMSRIKNATKKNPCIGLVVELDSYLISKLLTEMNSTEVKYNENQTCFAGTDADDDLINAYIRLVELLEQPAGKQKILAPMILKEIHYLLLSGPLGNLIKAANTKGNQYNQIAGAINLLKENYKEKINMEELAKSLNIAPSSFYKHFKNVTTISPLQYQKQLRLYEAQRLMLTGEHNAESASYLVGYESPTQFSREYKKCLASLLRLMLSNWSLFNFNKYQILISSVTNSHREYYITILI